MMQLFGHVSNAKENTLKMIILNNTSIQNDKIGKTPVTHLKQLELQPIVKVPEKKYTYGSSCENKNLIKCIL